MPFDKKITAKNKAKADYYRLNANSKTPFSDGIDPITGGLARMFFPTSETAERYKKYGGKSSKEINEIKAGLAQTKSNNELVREAHAVKKNSNRAPEFVTGKPKAKPKAKPTTTQTSSESRPRTSSEIAAGIKSTPSKMRIAGLPKSGNTMLMGSKEVETPSTFNTSAANNIAKAPNFAKMAEDGASVKEMRSTLKDYRKTVKGQVKEHKAGIKKQNKAAKFKKKSSKIDNRANKAKR
jgi:hypothetical protein